MSTCSHWSSVCLCGASILQSFAVSELKEVCSNVLIDCVCLVFVGQHRLIYNWCNIGRGLCGCPCWQCLGGHSPGQILDLIQCRLEAHNPIMLVQNSVESHACWALCILVMIIHCRENERNTLALE